MSHNPLFNTPPPGYGTKSDDHLLEQYKIYVETSQKTSDRRAAANTYFLTINSTLVTIAGALSAVFPQTRTPLLAIPIAGAVLDFTWLTLLSAYGRLNSAKFDVINDIETRLPCCPFTEEWQILRKKHTPINRLERAVPYLFLGLYAGLALYFWFA